MQSARSGSVEQRRLRRIEGLLLLCVAALLIAGTFAEMTARDRAAAASAAAAAGNVNTMTAPELASTLGVPAPDAAELVAVRTRRGPFGDVDAINRLRHPDGLPLLQSVRPGAEAGLIVRTPEQARRSLLLAAGLLLPFLFVAHVLTRRLQPRADPVLLPIAAVLSLLGVLALVSLKDPLRDMPAYWAQTLGIVIGGTAALVLGLLPRLHALPLHRYGYVYALAAIAATVVLGVAGVGPGDAAMVRLSVAGIQPIEIIKLLLVFFLAAYLADRGPLLTDPLRRLGPLPLPRRKDAAPLLVLYALPLALFALVRDMGPVLLLFGTFLLMVYLATGRRGYVAVGLAVLLVGAAVGYRLQFGVFHTRVDMWLSPWSNRHRGGEHLALGLWGLASGGPLGSGLGLGGTRFIPRGGSDLIFPALGEELGLPGTLLIALCFLVIAARGIGIARRTTSDFDRYLASGLAGLTALQAFVIMAGTLGLLPLTGITLPFVAYGKSSLLASFFTIGLLLALSSRAATAAASGAVFPAPPAFRLASARAGAVFALLLGVVVPLRLIWVQGMAADRLAVRRAQVPDADGVVRSHINPRLLTVAANIPRGRILDRAGRVLAETRDGRRVYPFGAAAAHVVGYLDPAYGGPTGFEASLDPQLAGYADLDALLPLWRRKDMSGFAYPRGQDVATSLDALLQRSTYEALLAGTAHLRDRRFHTAKQRAAAVLLDPATGQVLAQVSVPSFDPGQMSPDAFRRLRADVAGESPLLDRAADGFYPPGSTIKVAVASTMFADNDADFTFVCQHVDRNVIWSADGQTFARRAIVDDEGDQPHGLVNLSSAISVSCNVYFARAALLLGPQNLRSGLAAFGFSRLPTPAQFDAELPDIGYGQGPMLASPLEMAGVAQTVANGGARLAPQYLAEVPPQTAAQPLSPADAARIGAAMQRVTFTGTAAGVFEGFPYPVAGKTGTAQNHAADGAPHSWFIGYAPADHPRVAFAVLVENGGYGAQVAAPIAREILSAALTPAH